MRTRAAFLLAILAAAAPAPAYYQFIHYVNGGNAPEKFDLTALPSKTVTFLVSETGPTSYSAPDTFNSVLGQIQQAAAIWNGVATSDLRVAFGGLENGSTPQNAPGGDVVFEDLPPGLEGFGGPLSCLDSGPNCNKASAVTAADGSQFVPILRSSIHLNRNLLKAPGPSYNQSFLLTTIHEMGHALGLQHTFTSSAMSQATTRATTLAHPLDTDDLAGISSLYPNAAFRQLGSISGTITSGGKPVHLASVVALQPGSGAISAITNPDGSFHMDGVPPGQYKVYVHSMPSDANIIGPFNSDGSVAFGSSPINTVFYTVFGSGTTDFTQASPVVVTPGSITGGINLAVSTRADVPFYNGQIYAFLGTTPTAIMPAPVNMQASSLVTVVASIVGLDFSSKVSPLTVQIPGGASFPRSNGVRPYQANGYTYVALDLNFASNAQPGPQHLIFSTPDYTYVLPSGMYLTQSAPPSVTAVAANDDSTVVVTGSNWTTGTQLYFDSLPGTINSIDPVKGVALVTPPPGANAQQATLTAFNPDGQNSQFLQSGSPVTFSYGSVPGSLITAISPSSLPAGSEAMVDITGSGLSFTSGSAIVGFGTTDILVRKVVVLSPNHLQVDVSVTSGAALSSVDVTVASGFQFATAFAGFQITAPVAGIPITIPILTNAISGLIGAYSGSSVNLYGANLTTGTAAPTVTIGGLPVAVSFWTPTQLTLQLPSALPIGPALLTLNNGQANSLPVVVTIDPQPAGIAAVQLSNGSYIDAVQFAHAGDTLIVTLTNFASGSAPASSRVQIGLGGALLAPTQLAQYGNLTQVSFQVGAGVSLGGFDQLVVYLDGHSSFPAAIKVLP